MGAILLDIEGTTTPLSFVYDVLFPYARARLEPFIRDSWPTAALKEIADQLAEEHAADATADKHPPPWRTSTRDAAIASAVGYCAWLMDGNRKSPALKELQGLIWDRGYAAGELHGTVFPDVPPAFRRWQEDARTVAIYSSGSELAQRRLFATTEHGDLTPYIARFFDTAVGAKVETASYLRIAAALACAPGEICFVSDITRELAAARAAGLDVRLAVRPGNLPQDDSESFAQVTTLREL